MKAKGTAVRAHDVIPYILCLGPDGKSARSAQADKAFHPDDLRRQGSELKIDYDLYLDSQVLQPILRLCESIEGTERARLAECLGLDPTRYVSQSQSVHERQFFTLESQISDEERFRDAEKLSIKCPSCAVTFEFEGIEQNLKINQSGQAGMACPSCANVIPQASVALQVELLIRKYIARYYLGWTICDGPDGCGQRTRNVSVYAKRCLGFAREGGRCKGIVRLEYSDTELYNQLLYFRHLFDGDKLLDKVKGTGRYDEVRLLVNSNQQMISSLTEEVDRFLNKNGRRFVDMRSLFGFMDNRPKRIMVG